MLSDTFRKMSCYITQDDRIQILLTVLENMRMAANFKLGNQMKPHEKESRVSVIDQCVFCVNIEMLNPVPHLDRGNPYSARPL